MALMSDAERADVTSDCIRDAENPGPGLTKAQVRAVTDALDAWWETTGAAAANTAIPQPQRGIMTTRQKAFLFMKLLNAKYKVL